MISGFINPVQALFDPDLEKQGTFQLKFSSPHSDLNISETDRKRWFGAESPLEFAHSLSDQLGGQLEAGFLISGFYEDDWGGGEPIDAYMKTFVAVRSAKPVT